MSHEGILDKLLGRPSLPPLPQKDKEMSDTLRVALGYVRGDPK